MFDKLRKLVTAPPVTLLPRGGGGGCELCLTDFFNSFFFFFPVSCVAETRTQGFEHA